MNPAKQAASNVLLKLLMKSFKGELTSIAVFSAIVNVLMLSPTVYMLQVMDRVMLSKSEVTLLALSLLVLGLYAVQAFSDLVRSRIAVGAGLKFDAMVSDGLFDATFSRQLASSGIAPAQAFEDLMMIRQWLTGQAVFGFFDLPWAPVYLVVMFLLHPVLGWLTLIFMLVLALLAWWGNIVTKPLTKKASEEELELNAFVHKRLKNAEIVAAHGMVGNLFESWWGRQKVHLANQFRAGEVEGRFSIGSKEVRTFMQSLALGCGAVLAIRGEISVATMIAASLLTARATSPIDQIVSGWKGLTNVSSAYNRLNLLLAEALRVKRGVIDIGSPTQITLSLKKVSANAAGRSVPILNELNIEFRPSSISVIMGPSGAGKSTLARVMAGVWPSVEGEVELNHCSIDAIEKGSLGRLVGFLPQEIELFSGTVRENISRLGDSEPDQVIRAARLARIHDMILQLPKGYDTQVGEMGLKLSGGQRQLLALARAFYELPRLVILDEPNANLDEAGESSLAAALIELRNRGSTIIVVSHRQPVLAVADRLVVLRSGSVVFDGPVPKDRRELELHLVTENSPKNPRPILSDHNV